MGLGGATAPKGPLLRAPRTLESSKAGSGEKGEERTHRRNKTTHTATLHGQTPVALPRDALLPTARLPSVPLRFVADFWLLSAADLREKPSWF